MVSSGSLLSFLGATVLPKAFPEDRPLLTAVVGEAGSKVCPKMKQEKLLLNQGSAGGSRGHKITGTDLG